MITSKLKASALHAIAAITSVVFLPLSYAEPLTPLYAGAEYGLGRVNDSDFEDEDSAVKIFVGGKFNPYIGLEGAYNDFGKSENNGNSSEVTGSTLALMGIWPVSDNFELFVKGGQLWWRDKINVLAFEDTVTGNENFYGLGANFYVNEMWSVRAEWERYEVKLTDDEVGVDIDGTSTLDVASVGVAVNF